MAPRVGRVAWAEFSGPGNGRRGLTSSAASTGMGAYMRGSVQQAGGVVRRGCGYHTYPLWLAPVGAARKGAVCVWVNAKRRHGRRGLMSSAL